MAKCLVWFISEISQVQDSEEVFDWDMSNKGDQVRL